MQSFEVKNVSQEFEHQNQNTTQHNPQHRKGRKESKAATFGKTVLLYLHDVVYLLAAFLIVLLVVFRVVVVSGPSMKSTLLDGDNLLVLSSTFCGKPEYGDIVIVSKESFRNGSPIVKRVIATENQWVNIQDGKVYVGNDLENMELLEEKYTNGAATLGIDASVKFPIQVPGGCVFVMGDNRTNSTDSRSSSIGMVDEREIIGKAFFLVIPGTHGGTISRDFSRFGVLD